MRDFLQLGWWIPWSRSMILSSWSMYAPALYTTSRLWSADSTFRILWIQNSRHKDESTAIRVAYHWGNIEAKLSSWSYRFRPGTCATCTVRDQQSWPSILWRKTRSKFEYAVVNSNKHNITSAPVDALSILSYTRANTLFNLVANASCNSQNDVVQSCGSKNVDVVTGIGTTARYVQHRAVRKL